MSRNRSPKKAALWLGAAAIGAISVVVLLRTWPDRDDTAASAQERPSLSGLDLLADQDSDVLQRTGWLVAGEHIGLVATEELRFREGFTLVKAAHAQGDVATNLSVGDVGLAFDVPPGRYGYIIHAPAAAAALQQRIHANRMVEASGAPPGVLSPVANLRVVNSIDEIPRGSAWIASGEFLGFTTTTRLRFARSAGIRTLASADGPMALSAGGIVLEIPTGEIGYIVVRPTDPPAQ